MVKKMKISENEFLLNEEGLLEQPEGGNGLFKAGKEGVLKILATKDRKVDFVFFPDKVLSFVHSQLGYPAIYPLLPVRIDKPVKAVLMDLDGTSVHSEPFWVWVIEQSIAAIKKNPKFSFDATDLPFVSGHSVSEHLKYALTKYAPEGTLQQAKEHYFEITRREMKAILEGHGNMKAFQPTPGLKDFLMELKAQNIKIGLVTSGLYEKAYPEIVAAFTQLCMGDPSQFYDAIITAGYTIRKGEIGTLGELSPKPHPWLYSETACVGLGLDASQRHQVVGIEDSGAGVVSIRLAGFAAIGIDGGNIPASGTKGLCSAYCTNFDEILKALR